MLENFLFGNKLTSRTLSTFQRITKNHCFMLCGSKVTGDYTNLWIIPSPRSEFRRNVFRSLRYWSCTRVQSLVWLYHPCWDMSSCPVWGLHHQIHLNVMDKMSHIPQIWVFGFSLGWSHYAVGEISWWLHKICKRRSEKTVWICKMVENPLWQKWTPWDPLNLAWSKESEESRITFLCCLHKILCNAHWSYWSTSNYWFSHFFSFLFFHFPLLVSLQDCLYSIFFQDSAELSSRYRMSSHGCWAAKWPVTRVQSDEMYLIKKLLTIQYKGNKTQWGIRLWENNQRMDGVMWPNNKGTTQKLIIFQ